LVKLHTDKPYGTKAGCAIREKIGTSFMRVRKRRFGNKKGGVRVWKKTELPPERNFQKMQGGEVGGPNRKGLNSPRRGDVANFRPKDVEGGVEKAPERVRDRSNKGKQNVES